MPARSPGFSSTGPEVARTAVAQLVGDDVGQRRLAEARRAVQQHVIERLAALLRGRDRHLQVLADAVLPDVLVEHARAQSRFVLRVLVDAHGGDQTIVGHQGAFLLRELSQGLLQVLLEIAVAAIASTTVSTAFSARGR